MTKVQKTNSTKFKNSNCDKTQKLKLWLNSKTQTVTKLKPQNVMVIIVTVVTVIVSVTSFSKNNQPDTLTSVWCVQGSFSQPCDVFFSKNGDCKTINL